VRRHDRSNHHYEGGAVSYLLDYARHPMLGRRARNARVDERLRLNHPQFDGGAEVRVFVEDTSRAPHHREVAPRIRLRISDCAHQVNLEFGVETPELRANALFKIDTLLDALSKFRHGLIAEAALFERRQGR
jgi:hypothetical protein